MTLAQLSFDLPARVAQAIGAAEDVDTAVAAMAAELSAAFATRATAFVRSGTTWRAVGSSLPDNHGWQLDADRSSGEPCRLIRANTTDAVGTRLLLSDATPPVAAVILDGDLSAFDAPLRGVAVVASFLLTALSQRTEKQRFERDLIRGYALLRRLGRLRTVESVAQHVVDKVAELLNADRVSLSLYTSSDDSLAIVATHGFPREDVADVRVRPGDWVVGHVYSSKRALFVSDVRLVPAMARHGDQYRSFSFAAVPLLTGHETVGVLTVTDKREGRAFDRHDEFLLRSITVAAAASLVAARRESEAAQLAYAATIDALTGLMNRQSLDHRLHQEVERSRREGTSLAVLMVDVDDFKHINDSHGHQVGDVVLQAVGAAIRSAVRIFDVCARYGGDEFAVVMPNCDRERAIACAERIRARVQELSVRAGDEQIPRAVTLSIGVAVADTDEKANDLIARADRCLYRAKAEGKNLVRADEFTEVAVHEGPWPRPIEFDRSGDAEPVSAPDANQRPQLPYVLVVDVDETRLNLYLDAIKPFHCGLLVARTGRLAAELIERFGPPVALIVDLQLPSGDAFSAIDQLPESGSTAVVAWSPSREVREFAASRIRVGRVLSASVAPATLMAAVQGSISRQQNQSAMQPVEPPRDTPIAGTTQDVIEHVRNASDARGVAIYLKDALDGGFRVAFDWAGETVPHPAVDVAMVFERVRRSGRTVLHHELHDVLRPRPGSVRGVVGVPIRAQQEIVGVICVFDVTPLRLDARSIAELESVAAALYGGAERPGGGSALAPGSTYRSGRHTDTLSHPPDASTGEVAPALLDRNGGEFAVARERSRAKREGRQLSVVLFGLASQPKSGQAETEEVDSVAETLLSTIRQSDLPIRWSETELVVVFTGLDTHEARPVAERVRAALTAGVRNRVAVSGGIEHVQQDESFPEVVDRARKKVAVAVGQGLNRIV